IDDTDVPLFSAPFCKFKDASREATVNKSRTSSFVQHQGRPLAGLPVKINGPGQPLTISQNCVFKMVVIFTAPDSRLIPRKMWNTVRRYGYGTCELNRANRLYSLNPPLLTVPMRIFQHSRR